MPKTTPKSKRPASVPATRRRPGDGRRRADSAPAEGETPRAPQQDRGQRRVDEILDAAEQVALELGWEAASTQAIAERAGASVGSLFHFFPTKDAILVALARRYSTLMYEANERAMPMDVVWLPPRQLFERIVRAQVTISETIPAFANIHNAVTRKFGPDAGPLCELNESIYERVRAFCSVRTPRLSPGQREANVRLMVGLVHGAMHEAAALPPPQREDVYQVAIDMLANHLSELDRRYGPQGRRTGGRVNGQTRKRANG
ncbi:MAG: TetR/AcrR family transcriptional regulator [Gemmatimonadaceae bacterium]